MTSAAFEDLAKRFHQTIEKVETFDARVPEDSALIGLAADIVPKVTRLLRQGVDLLSAVEQVYDGSQPETTKASDEDSLFHIGKLISTELASRDLADVAFLARNELSHALSRLEKAAVMRKVDCLALATHSESGLRCLRKALVSVESAIFEFEEQSAPERRWYDVEVSLQIRKLYWNLRNETVDGLAADEDVESRLRRVLYRIMDFRELSVYPLLRVDDRVSLRDLLKRILDWLNSDQRNLKEAERLWIDLTSFTTLAVQVSRRQELQTFDLSVLRKVYRQLFDGDQPIAGITGAHFAELEQLLGLDEELDDLVCSRIEYPKAWQQTLKRVIHDLDRPHRSALQVDLLSDADFL